MECRSPKTNKHGRVFQTPLTSCLWLLYLMIRTSRVISMVLSSSPLFPHTPHLDPNGIIPAMAGVTLDDRQALRIVSGIHGAWMDLDTLQSILADRTLQPLAMQGFYLLCFSYRAGELYPEIWGQKRFLCSPSRAHQGNVNLYMVTAVSLDVIALPNESNHSWMPPAIRHTGEPSSDGSKHYISRISCRHHSPSPGFLLR